MKENIYNRRKKAPSGWQSLSQQGKSLQFKREAPPVSADKNTQMDKRAVDEMFRQVSEDGKRTRGMGGRTLDKTSSPYQNADTNEPVRADESDRAAQREIDKLGSDISLG